jgi:hypothetical protein
VKDQSDPYFMKNNDLLEYQYVKIDFVDKSLGIILPIFRGIT